MGKDIDLMQAVRDEDLSLLQKLLERSRSQRSSKCPLPSTLLDLFELLSLSHRHVGWLVGAS